MKDVSVPLALQDVILPPIAPFPWGMVGASVMAIFLTALLTIGGVLRYKRRQTRSTAASQPSINELQQRWAQGIVNERQAAYFLARLLCEFLQVKQLSPQCPEVLEGQETKWQELFTCIHEIRYQGKQNRMKNAHYIWVDSWLTVHLQSDAESGQ